MVKYLKSLKPPQFSWNFPGKKTEKLSGIYFSSVAPPQPIIIYIIIHITSHHTNTNTTPHTMSAFSTMFTHSGDVVDPTGDTVAQIKGETDPQPVAASAAAPEQPAQVAPPAAQDPPPPAQDPPPPRPELDFITAVKFEEESKSLDFRCSVEGGEIRVKLLHVDTKGANTGATKIPEAGEPGFGMPVEMLANLVLEKTIYAIMENEKEAIQKYLKEA